MAKENEVRLYAAKPVEDVQAVRFDGTNLAAVLEVTGGKLLRSHHMTFGGKQHLAFVRLNTGVGELMVNVGDWVVRRNWKVWTCRDSEFLESFAEHKAAPEPPPMKTLAMTVRVVVPRATPAGDVVDGIKAAIQTADYTFDMDEFDVKLGNHFVNAGD